MIGNAKDDAFQRKHKIAAKKLGTVANLLNSWKKEDGQLAKNCIYSELLVAQAFLLHFQGEPQASVFAMRKAFMLQCRLIGPSFVADLLHDKAILDILQEDYQAARKTLKKKWETGLAVCSGGIRSADAVKAGINLAVVETMLGNNANASEYNESNLLLSRACFPEMQKIIYHNEKVKERSIDSIMPARGIKFR